MEDISATLNIEQIRHKIERHRSHVSESLSDSGSNSELRYRNSQLKRELSQDSNERSNRRMSEKECEPVKGEKLIEIEKTETNGVSNFFCKKIIYFLKFAVMWLSQI